MMNQLPSAASRLVVPQSAAAAVLTGCRRVVQSLTTAGMGCVVKTVVAVVVGWMASVLVVIRLAEEEQGLEYVTPWNMKKIMKMQNTY